MLKAFRYRIYPNKSQQSHLNHIFGCSRFIYNTSLYIEYNLYKSYLSTLNSLPINQQKQFESDNKKNAFLPYRKLRDENLPRLKQENPWLNTCYSQTIQASMEHACNAFIRFFQHKAKHLNNLLLFLKELK